MLSYRKSGEILKALKSQVFKIYKKKYRWGHKSLKSKVDVCWSPGGASGFCIAERRVSNN